MFIEIQHLEEDLPDPTYTPISRFNSGTEEQTSKEFKTLFLWEYNEYFQTRWVEQEESLFLEAEEGVFRETIHKLPWVEGV